MSAVKLYAANTPRSAVLSHSRTCIRPAQGEVGAGAACTDSVQGSACSTKPSRALLEPKPHAAAQKHPGSPHAPGVAIFLLRSSRGRGERAWERGWQSTLPQAARSPPCPAAVPLPCRNSTASGTGCTLASPGLLVLLLGNPESPQGSVTYPQHLGVHCSCTSCSKAVFWTSVQLPVAGMLPSLSPSWSQGMLQEGGGYAFRALLFSCLCTCL